MKAGLYESIQRMRQLTELGHPFSITYMSYSTKEGKSKGLKHVARCALRKGYRRESSDLWNQLIAYTDLDSGERRLFHLPLLLRFNEYTISHD